MKEKTKQPTKDKVDRVRIYTITVTDYQDGTQSFTLTNDGFSPLEVMGLVQVLKEQPYRENK